MPGAAEQPVFPAGFQSHGGRISYVFREGNETAGGCFCGSLQKKRMGHFATKRYLRKWSVDA